MVRAQRDLVASTGADGRRQSRRVLGFRCAQRMRCVCRIRSCCRLASTAAAGGAGGARAYFGRGCSRGDAARPWPANARCPGPMAAPCTPCANPPPRADAPGGGISATAVYPAGPAPAAGAADATASPVAAPIRTAVAAGATGATGAADGALAVLTFTRAGQAKPGGAAGRRQAGKRRRARLVHMPLPGLREGVLLVGRRAKARAHPPPAVAHRR